MDWTAIVADAASWPAARRRSCSLLGLPLAYWLATTRWRGQFRRRGRRRPAAGPAADRAGLLHADGDRAAESDRPGLRSHHRGPAAVLVSRDHPGRLGAVQPAVRRAAVRGGVLGGRPPADRGRRGAWASRGSAPSSGSRCPLCLAGHPHGPGPDASPTRSASSASC